MTHFKDYSSKANLRENKKIVLVAIKKIKQMKKTYANVTGNFRLTANENATIDVQYLIPRETLSLGCINTEDLDFSDYEELSNELVEFLWDLCVALQKHYGRGEYKDHIDDFEDLPKPKIEVQIHESQWVRARDYA